MSAATLERELSTVLDDLGQWEVVPDHHSVHTYSPILMSKIRHMIDHGIHQRHGSALGRLLRAWYHLLEKHTDLAREARVWAEESNVIISSPFDNLGPQTASSVALIGAPYSGIPFMLLDVLVPAELTPRGRLQQFNFAGINFATPSQASDSLQYSTPSGTQGTPSTTGMDLTVFYSNKTAPIGRRGFRAWTGWVFDPAAKIVIQVYNPDPVVPRSYDFAWLMRSSPCQNVQFEKDHAFHFRQAGPHSEYHSIVNQIHGAVLGLSGLGSPGMHGGHGGNPYA